MSNDQELRYTLLGTVMIGLSIYVWKVSSADEMVGSIALGSQSDETFERCGCEKCIF